MDVKDRSNWECQCPQVTGKPCPALPYHFRQGPYSFPLSGGKFVVVTKHCAIRMTHEGRRGTA